ncbi:MAG: N-acetyltransferase [Bacilli bacterium]|nr:N-acetyltransferase [Bacilli bacterium]
MNIKIRHEEEKDYYRVLEIARDAFWNLYFPGAVEHYVVHKIRNHPDFIKELSFVIEVDNTIEGAIFYTKSAIVTKEGKVPTISFGPVFISPRYHRRGLGKKLISYSIEQAKKNGYRAILTLGYDYHYAIYGFKSGINYHISMDDGKYLHGLLVLPLFENALNGISGYASFSDVYEVDDQEVEEFDKIFPPKVKEVLPCQKEYEEACALIDE